MFFKLDYIYYRVSMVTVNVCNESCGVQNHIITPVKNNYKDIKRNQGVRGNKKDHYF